VLRPSPIGLRDLAELINHDPAAPDVVEAARRVKEEALVRLGLGSSIVASWVYIKCYHHIPTTAIPTAAVALLGNGSAMLLYNPQFFVALGPEGAEFVPYHEALHLIFRHLHVQEHLKRNPVWDTATEVIINHVVMSRLRRGIPEVEVELLDVQGKVARQSRPVGVVPKAVHDLYREDLTHQGLSPVSYEDFVRTDFGCFAELTRMRKPPGPGLAGLGGECVHRSDDDGSAASDGKGVPSDAETGHAIAGQVLATVMQTAVQGNQRAREEILNLADRSEDGSTSISKLWSDLGLARLRGHTPTARRVDWWKTWLNDTLASLLKEGERLVYAKKRGALDLMLGNDTILMRRGDDELKVVLIALDTSGSMSQEIVDHLTQLVGYTDGVEAHWVSFDGRVMPFEAGERVSGGGGTDFANVMHYVEGRLEVEGRRLHHPPDAVIMLTDGYAEPIRPLEPEKWIWLITADGDDSWIRAQDNPMKSHQLLPVDD
jgi:predicted metal-dependent peptidase